ncbi:MAG TPA: MOSC N-terminal beta barrel domain-containing protein [Chitinophagaceae bacterium]|nr:MOSC N-terminal beta barrel domain-containing protein [Chitinophagaceae bacterium]
MLTVSELYIYPIKSLGGIAVKSAKLTSRGLEHDRRMMLVDENNVFLSQRTLPLMALLQPVMKEDGFYIQHKKELLPPLRLPGTARAGTAMVTVWQDTCLAEVFDVAVNNWCSNALQLKCKLVYMPEQTLRYADRHYAHNNEITSFADDYPMLMIGQASLDDLNARLSAPLPMNRFRPNLVFAGGSPYLEDQMAAFSINSIHFKGAKPCGRCVMTTVDQDTGSKNKEPLQTLATYRRKNNKILFGQNLVHNGEGVIQVGDILSVTEYQPAAI